MTVGQLIPVLQSYPQDMRVVVNGYEDSYDDLSPKQISAVRIALNTGKHVWEGRHGRPDERCAWRHRGGKSAGNEASVELTDGGRTTERSDWREVTLGDLIDIKHGFAFKGASIHDEPQGDVLLTPGNFAIGGGFKGDRFKYYDGSVPEEFVLDEGDLLVTMTDLSKQSDTLGYPALVPASTNGRRYLHNQRLGKVLPKPESTEGRPWGQPLKKAEGAPLNLG